MFVDYSPSAVAPTFDSAADIREILARTRYPGVNVDAYGATGDGLADDTQAFVDAIAEVKRSGGPLLLGPRQYVIKQTLLVTGVDGFSMQGAGALDIAEASVGTQLLWRGAAATTPMILLEDCRNEH